MRLKRKLWKICVEIAKSSISEVFKCGEHCLKMLLILR